MAVVAVVAAVAALRLGRGSKFADGARLLTKALCRQADRGLLAAEVFDFP